MPEQDPGILPRMPEQDYGILPRVPEQDYGVLPSVPEQDYRLQSDVTEPEPRGILENIEKAVLSMLRQYFILIFIHILIELNTTSIPVYL